MDYTNGDPAGFDELLRRYKRPLFGYVYKMLGDKGEAEDVFQETFIRIIRNASKYDPEKRFSSWLFSIAHNLSIDSLRTRKTRPLPFADPPEIGASAAYDPELSAMNSQTGRVIQAAIAGLPEQQRQVFIMREYSGMSFKEIAEATESPLNTVLGRMHLAVKKLRSSLSELAEV